MSLSGETRWKCEYVMLERAEQQKYPLKLAEDDEELDLPVTAKLTPNDWSLVNKAVKLLKPLYDATLAAENETSCISDIIPLSKKMKVEVQRVNEIGVGTLKSELSKEMARYLEGNDIRSQKFPGVELCKSTAISTFIDPLYKMAGFKDKDKAERAKRIVLSLMGSAVTPQNLNPQMKRHRFQLATASGMMS